MDRQALLEQKRQRLQELKQRRSELAALPSIDLKAPVAVKVDFAVQVDLPTHIQQTPVHTIYEQPNAPRFDKAVQTDFENEEEEKHEEIEVTHSPVEEPQEIEPTPQEIVEETLQTELEKTSLHFKFSDLRLGVKDLAAAAEVDTKEPFSITHGISDFLDRPISGVATSAKFPNVVLVSYGKPKSQRKTDHITHSQGLAIVFNRDATPMVPEFFLQCTSAITQIQFNVADPFKVIAGLQNGHVVIWDLTDINPSQISVLPTLQTTSLTSLGEKINLNYVRHTLPIVLLQQLDLANQLTSGFVSVCADGIINLWSPNFLAFPKADSAKLSTSEKLKDRICATDALLLSSQMRVADDKHVRPELRFLDQLLVGSTDGKVYRLSSRGTDSNRGNVAQIYSETETQTDDSFIESPYVLLSVTCLAELRISVSKSLLVSAHNDWQLRIWDLTQSLPIATILTSTVVSLIFTRPEHPYHLITVGNVLPPKVKPCIQFWDLEAKLLGPIYTFPAPDLGSQVTSATFSANGDKLVVAFANGELKVWEIEEPRLDAQANQVGNRNIDEGILSFIQSL